MTGLIGFSRRAAWLFGAAATLVLGCARSIEFEPGNTTGADGGSGGGGGGASTGGSGGAGGAVTTTTSTGTPGACVDDSSCTSLNGACTTGVCADGVCTAVPANQFAACDDGKFCTVGDSCQNGVCAGSQQKLCEGGDACHVAVCDEATQGCVTTPGNNNAQCDDGDSCTYFGTCSNGVCQKGPSIDCSFLNTACTMGVCLPGGNGCSSAPVNNGNVCNDGQFCTQNDTCQNGACTGGPPLQCAPPGGCFISICDETVDSCTSVPGNDGMVCEDGNACTIGTTCLTGVCAGGTPSADGIDCNDGTSCTTGEICAAGVCGGGVGPAIYFADDFHDDSKGWKLGQDWQIGPAMASIPGSGNPDPAMDHTPTADNGVAGVVIGGNAPTALHPYYYIESPAFDTSAAAGPVILGFYRWLNSDYDPFMHNTIEVWNGTQWVTLWTTGGPPGVMDSQWMFIQHDLTNYKNAQMRVRFGFNITSGGVFTIGSWNIDDVLVASGACP